VLLGSAAEAADDVFEEKFDKVFDVAQVTERKDCF
jgi:hypothetical protein